MSDAFEIGEIAISQNLVMMTWNNGLEVEIIGPLEFIRARIIISGSFIERHMYKVRWPDGEETWQSPHELRKRPPPQDWNSILTSSPREAEPA